MNIIFICYCRFQIIELYNIFSSRLYYYDILYSDGEI
jgi:hypothetical protein